MNFRALVQSVFGGRRSSIIYLLLTGTIVAKVLWGYWARDLTYGDTASYFHEAIRWHLDGQVNIVWSPLYTVYFASWLGITQDAAVATFLHRVGLILLSTGLVAWLGFLTLPRALAAALVVWWIALPIHYDTLYEVHLFGALPILAMAVVNFLVGDKWRWPLLLGIALLSTFLIRNEYVLAVGVLGVWAMFDLLRQKRHVTSSELRLAGYRYGAVLLASGLLITYFYSVSIIKGSAIAEVSARKHTLNMCQVYAFGYQQRHSDWSGSPWTECSSLMNAKFGAPLPSLSAMIVANPREVVEHFLWNLSLTRAGFEVLLFNATSARDNPDYVPVSIVPVVPSLLLALTFIILIAGANVVFGKSSPQYAEFREKLTRLSPLMLAVVVIGFAVVITQRPRPSYFLGFGVLYMWYVLVMFSAFFVRSNKLDGWWGKIFLAALVLMVPAYKSLPLSSKSGSLGFTYSELRPQAQRLCQGSGVLAIAEATSDLSRYLCSPYPSARRGVIGLGSLPADALSAPANLVNALDAASVTALVFNPFLAQNYPGLKSCHELRDALITRGWEQLTYSQMDRGGCLAAYAKLDSGR